MDPPPLSFRTGTSVIELYTEWFLSTQDVLVKTAESSCTVPRVTEVVFYSFYTDYEKIIIVFLNWAMPGVSASKIIQCDENKFN